ncbi:MAG: penicillin-binding protein 2 [Flavobacteriaceae bacterium]|nr:penicillin-binding protein 2 [Flavobacteriaceae bacterium]
MNKQFPLYISVFIISVLFIVKLFVIQVLHNDEKSLIVGDASVSEQYTYPERGYILDRNNQILVTNQLSYDLMVIPIETTIIDTLEICALLKIDKEYFKKRIYKSVKYSRRLPSVLLENISKVDYAYLQEKLHKYKGFYMQKRSIRKYPKPSAANILGYIGEVSGSEIRKNKYYHQGELIGIQGVEKQYEIDLRGFKGVKYLKKNIHNKIIGSFKEGKYDKEPIHGKDITLTIDAVLQQYGEKLMVNKRGGIVAIDPSNGEVLALITAPSYDPNDMVGRKRSGNSVRLFGDKFNKPMFDRSLQAQYAPGSTFKMINALIGVQENVINIKTTFDCRGGYAYGNKKQYYMKCHCGIYGKVNFKNAISKSCNTYFANTYKRIIEKYTDHSVGLDIWADHVKTFGLGAYLGYDLPVGQKGHVPVSEYYDNSYRRWRAETTISNAIGQGELLTTPIQLANMAVTIANRGHYYTPHFIKKINDSIPLIYNTKHDSSINKDYFEPVVEAMHDVFKHGTGRYSQIEGIEICGKTGTVQNKVRINGRVVELDDHSILIAFAPKDNPKIAIAVYIENGGYGSAIAAPIASLMIEKFLTDGINKYTEDRMINTSLTPIYNRLLENTKDEN